MIEYNYAVPIEIAIKAQEDLEKAITDLRSITPDDLYCWTCDYALRPDEEAEHAIRFTTNGSSI